MEAVEHLPRHIDIWHAIFFVEHRPAQRVFFRLDQDHQVLLHQRIFFRGQAFLQPCDRVARRLARTLEIPGIQVEDLVVQSLHSLLSIAFRRELRFGAIHPFGVGVAALHPLRLVLLRESETGKNGKQKDDSFHLPFPRELLDVRAHSLEDHKVRWRHPERGWAPRVFSSAGTRAKDLGFSSQSLNLHLHSWVLGTTLSAGSSRSPTAGSRSYPHRWCTAS